jgi:hypothetical protein
MKPVTVIGPFAIVGSASPSCTSSMYRGARRLRVDLGVLRARFARDVAIGSEAPRVAGREQVAGALVVEIDVIDLLDRAAREARLMLDEVLQVSARCDRRVAPDRLVPLEVRAGPHRVDAGHAADVAARDAAAREQERRQRDDVAVGRAASVLGIAPERVVVADAVRVVTDVVARGLVAPRLDRVLDRLADAPAQLVERRVGDADEFALQGFAH